MALWVRKGACCASRRGEVQVSRTHVKIQAYSHVCNSSVIGQGGQRQEDHSGLLAASLAPNPVRNPVEASRWPVFCQL